MSLFVFANFYSVVLTQYCATTSTTISVGSAAGLPVLGTGEVIPLVLTDAATESVYEIVYVTAVSGTTLTVLRAQEGTTALNWQQNDLISCDPTAASVGASNISPATTSSQPVPLGQALNSVAVTSTQNITLGNVLRTIVTNSGATAGVVLTLEPGTVVGQEVTFLQGNAGAFSLTVNSNVSTGSPFFRAPDTTELYTWYMNTFGGTLTLQWDGTNWKMSTTGQVIGLPAGAPNEFTTLGQFALTAVPFAPGTSGYIKIPSVGTAPAIYIQWVQTTWYSQGYAGASIAGNWPIAFPNACSFAMAGQLCQGTGYGTTAVIKLTSNTGYLAEGASPDTNTYITSMGFIAIGY